MAVIFFIFCLFFLWHIGGHSASKYNCQAIHPEFFVRFFEPGLTFADWKKDYQVKTEVSM